MMPLLLPTAASPSMSILGRIFSPNFQPHDGTPVHHRLVPGFDFQPRPQGTMEAAAGGPISNFTPGNTGVVPPNRFPGFGFQPHQVGTQETGFVPRHRRLMGLRRWHLHQPVGIMLGDDIAIPDMTSIPSAPTVSFDTITPSLPQPIPTYNPPAPAATSGWGDVFGGLLGKVVQVGSQYELSRLNLNLMSKQYSPQNVQSAIGAYQGQTAVTAAQAQAEMMNRQLEYERTAGTRSGNVMSTGLVVAGLASLLVVLMMRKPSAAPKAA